MQHLGVFQKFLSAWKRDAAPAAPQRLRLPATIRLRPSTRLLLSVEPSRIRERFSDTPLRLHRRATTSDWSKRRRHSASAPLLLICRGLPVCPRCLTQDVTGAGRCLIRNVTQLKRTAWPLPAVSFRTCPCPRKRPRKTGQPRSLDRVTSQVRQPVTKLREATRTPVDLLRPRLFESQRARQDTSTFRNGTNLVTYNLQNMILSVGSFAGS
jgi:hypothetical protein